MTDKLKMKKKHATAQARRPNSFMQALERFFPLLIACFGAAAYSNIFQAPFIFDDVGGIGHFYPDIFRYEHPWLRLIRESRPVEKLTFALQYAFLGHRVWAYHLGNFLIHLAAGLTLFGIVRRTLSLEQFRRDFESLGPQIAFAIALLWTVHPLTTQSVTYLSQRAESLMGMFYLLTLYAVIRAHQSRHSRRWLTLSVLFCGLGMGTKTNMMTAPVLVLIYDRIFLSESFSELIRKRWPLYLGLVATWLFQSHRLLFLLLSEEMLTETGIVPMEAFKSQAQLKSAGFGISHISPTRYGMAQPHIILHYLKLSFWPVSLCFDYLWIMASNFKQTLPDLFALSVLAFGSLALFVRNPALGFVGVWFWLQIAPRSSVVPASDLAAEQRMYLPLIAIVAGFVFACHWFFKRVDSLVSESDRRVTVLPVIGLLLLATTLGTLTFMRNSVYQTEESIWRDTVAKRPANFRALNHLGSALLKTEHPDQALPVFDQAIQVNPRSWEAYTNKGVYYAQKGEIDKAIQQFEKALAFNSTHQESLHNLGVAYFDRKEYQKAKEYFLRVNDRTQRVIHLRALNNLGIIFAMEQNWERAVAHLEIAHHLDPLDPGIKSNLANAHAALKQQNAA